MRGRSRSERWRPGIRTIQSCHICPVFHVESLLKISYLGLLWASPLCFSHLVLYSISARSYFAPLLPCGHALRLVLLGTHGDVSYIGLNGLALFDATGAQIPIGARNAAAQPESIAVALPKCKVRLVPDTLATDHGSCTRVFSHFSLCIKYYPHMFDSRSWVSSLRCLSLYHRRRTMCACSAICLTASMTRSMRDTCG